jgi:hypothetical protein
MKVKTSKFVTCRKNGNLILLYEKTEVLVYPKSIEVEKCHKILFINICDNYTKKELYSQNEINEAKKHIHLEIINKFDKTYLGEYNVICKGKIF